MTYPNSAGNDSADPQTGGFTPLPSLSRTGSVIQAIKGYIISHKLNPGDPLPSENQLSQELQGSRSAIREAIGQLQALDIVRVERGKGTFVGDLSLAPLAETILLRASLEPGSLNTLRDVVEVRKMLDIGSARAIVAALNGSTNPALSALVTSMEKKAQAGEPFLDEDNAFHQQLYTHTSALLSQLGTTLWSIHMQALTSADVRTDELEDTARAHRKMLTAAEAGDLDTYLVAVDEHYAPLLNSLA